MRALILLFLIILTFVPPTWALAAEECKGGISIPASDATQGGYKFEYESNSGTMEGVQCTLHKAQNKLGSVKTPINWVDTKNSSTLLFDILPGCASNPDKCDCTKKKPCDIELQRTRHSKHWNIKTDVTKLSYGIHYEYKENADAVIAQKKKEEAASEKPLPLIFRLRGFAETIKGEVIFIDLEARSVFVPEKNLLSFNIVNRGDTLVQLTSDPTKVERKMVAASWSPVTSEKFRKSYNLKGELADLPATADQGGSVNGSVEIGKVTIDERAVLMVYVDGELIAGGTMDLYSPAE